VSTPLALIAEDEPLLAENLRAELAKLWPALRFADTAGDGETALRRALALRPDLLFLDIRMPALSGLEVAQALAEDWPAEAAPFPLLVFVTAYDQYALAAFERAALDYVLKPVQSERLAQTVARLQTALGARAAAAPDAPLDAAVERLRGLLAAPPTASATAPLRVIQAGVGAAIHLVPIDEVLYFEAADKYVRVVTRGREHLIRLSLRELIPQLDASRFWQIHRGTVVRCDAIASATRDESGKLTLALRDHADRLTVSRLYAQLFKAM
jgi:DNA-binding LytR/AlgR family response regulator